MIAGNVVFNDQTKWLKVCPFLASYIFVYTDTINIVCACMRILLYAFTSSNKTKYAKIAKCCNQHPFCHHAREAWTP